MVVAFGLSGCMGFGDDVSRTYDDANSHYGEKVEGGVSEDRTISIPGGTGNLRVALAIKASGGVNFELMNPLGVEVAELNQGGAVDKKDDSWYATSDPMQGDWEIEINVGGSGSYSVGFYYS